MRPAVIGKLLASPVGMLQWKRMHEVIDQISLEMARRIVERLRRDPEGVLSKARSTLEHWMKRHADNPRLMRCNVEWIEILKRPVEEICAILLDEGDEGQRLRQNDPFVGILPAEEVWEVKRQIRRHEAK
jgi:hypothetical protein